MFNVVGTNTYVKEVEKLSGDYRVIVEKLPSRLSISPFSGDPLGFPFLREKRIKEKRIYYLVYEDLKLVLLVAISGKKNQQVTIDHIKLMLDEYRKVAERVSKQVS